MMELITKKKKKKTETLLLTDFNCLTNDEVLETLEHIKKKLPLIFREHIGEEFAITPYDLFEKIFNIRPQSIDPFKRGYWWNIIKKLLRELRAEDKLFVINQGFRLYVLETKAEAEKFKAKCDRQIGYLNLIKDKADDWVKYKRYRRLKLR